jgi:histone H3/H4
MSQDTQVVKKTTKPTLFPNVADEEARLQNHLDGQSKEPSSQKLIKTHQKSVFVESKTMTDEAIEAEVAKTKKGAKKEEVVDPKNYKYKLTSKEQKEFLSTLAPAQTSILPSAWKSNLDVAANVILVKPQRPMSGYFLFSNQVRDSLKGTDTKYSIAELANKIKTDWAALGEASQQKWQKKNEAAVALFEPEKAKYDSLLALQKKIVEFYSQRLKLTVPVPGTEVASRGVAWTAAIPEAQIKRMIQSTPGLDQLTISKDVIRTTGIALEAFIVWLGQQLAIRTVRAGKKTVQAPTLKAFAVEEPQKAYLAKMAPIIALPAAATKATKDKPAKDDKAQTKLKLVKGKDNAMDNDDDNNDNDNVQDKKGKKTVAKKDEKEAKKAPEGAMKNFVKKGDAKSDTKFDDDADYADAVAAANPSKLKKKIVTDINDPLYIPTDILGTEGDVINLNKEKKIWGKVVEVKAANGDVSYENDGDEMDKADVKKYLKFKSAVTKLQNSSPAWNAHHKASSAQKRKATEPADGADAVKKQKKK